ncbi:MAG: cupredoxin domain-containing protein [Candidatus Pacebacteria bacterium]|nr:cupredoxin domain-containing protein [Candidatus Paceibacterota bacterium]
MYKKIIVLSVIVVIILAIVIVLAINLKVQQKPANLQGSENTPVNAGTSSENSTGNNWENAQSPVQSSPLEQSEVPKEAIKISITEQGIAPASFEAKSGEKVILSVSSGDQWTHIFKFKDKSLEEVAVGVGPKETRAITFLAPKDKGEYEYYCDVPGHIERGEKGTMIVK